MDIQKKSPKKNIDGLLLIDKPSGMSSNKCLQMVKRIAGISKAGHTGTLDPLATGLLPMCCGKATRLAELLLIDNKSYSGTVCLGSKTSTADREGEVIARSDIPNFDQKRLNDLAKYLCGDMEQIPPIYSAIKVAGRPMYQLARGQNCQNRKIPEIKSRKIHIYSLSLTDRWNQGDRLVDIRVSCSKGTYIRTLAEVIAEKLGTLGHLTSLRRTACGTFTLKNAVTLEQLESTPLVESILISMEKMVAQLPSIEINCQQKQKIANGVSLKLPRTNLRGTIAVLSAGSLVALARADNTDGTDVTLVPTKVFCE